MDQVEEIKGKVDIVELVQEYVPLKRAGRNFKGLCPFHGEKTPSFMVNPELQIYKCFGCGEGGDAYTFLQKIEGMEFGEALQMLAKRVGVTLTSYRPNGVEETREKLISINTLAAQAYHYLLTKHKAGKKALEYLKERGISGESVEKFQLGFAPDEWEFLTNYMRKKKYGVDDLRRTGLIVEGRGYDRFRNRIMFPLANGRGQIMGFAGRVLPDADEKSGGKYVNTPETEIYHKSELLYGLDVTRAEIKKAGWAVVVEGEIDMIASWQAGIKNVAAIKGSALTEKQVESLRRISDTVVLALDADVAGDSAARRGIEIADKSGLMVKMVKLLGAKDPGEMAISDPDEWKKAVGEAIPIWDFYIESAVERYGLDVTGKKKIGQELLPIWVNISDEIVKAHYIRQLAKILDVGEDDVRNQLAKVRSDKVTKVQSDREEVKKTRREVREERVVQMAMLGERTKELKEIPWIRSDFWKRVVERIDDLPSELKMRVQELMLTDEEFSEKKWVEAKDLLEQVDVEERLTGEEDPKKISSLTNRRAELTRDK